MVRIALALLLISPLPQERPPLPPEMAVHRSFARVAISGERALDLVDFMDPSYRVPGNEPFNAALHRVAEVLEAAGYREEGSSQEGTLTYRFEHRSMERPTWEPLEASIRIAGESRPLMTLESNVNLIAANSYSTPPGGIEAELVDVGPGTSGELGGIDVRGKIVMGDANVRQLFSTAVQKGGALGVLSFHLPSYNQSEVNRDIAPMTSISHDPDAESWGLLLSRNARDALRGALAGGPVRVHVLVRTRVYPSEELTLVADVRGSERPEERLVFSAHVQESGANDNASGVAALAEIARAFGEGVRNGAFQPRRTISMIWGDEIISTRRYIQDDSLRARDIRWGISLDMVGENTEETGGTFLIEKMPDPSAIWTRGEDQHTEWGGRPLTTDQLTPHFFNDFMLGRCLDQAQGTGWVVRTNPFEGGSDHVPFLRADIPGLLLWHFTDQFYHTDGDRLEMVSAATLENVAVCAATGAMALTSPSSDILTFMIQEVEKAALDRIQAEGELSRAAVRAGGLQQEERTILTTWAEWYDGALESLEGVKMEGEMEAAVSRRLQEARQRVARAAQEETGTLGQG